MRDPPDSAVLESAVFRVEPLGVCSAESNVVPLRQLAHSGADLASSERSIRESFAQRLVIVLIRALAAWPH
jgi:hypothetical protein